MMIINTDDYVDAVTAAEIRGTTRATISRQCKDGRFPGMVRVGHFWLIPREAVENFKPLKKGRKKQEVKTADTTTTNNIDNSEA